jgi:hypothetical protein
VYATNKQTPELEREPSCSIVSQLAVKETQHEYKNQTFFAYCKEESKLENIPHQVANWK